MTNPNMRFNPPPNWPPVPAGWVPPAGWEPEEAWGPAPDGWQLWVADDAKAGWFARHKVLVGVGGALVALALVLGFVGVALSGSDDASPTKPMADAPEKPAADKPADKAPAPDKPPASDEPAGESTLPEGTDCASVADEAISASEESANEVKILKIRSLKMVEDNRTSYEIPTGPESALVLSCTGLAAGSNGQDDLPVLIKMTVDSDGDYFVAYEDN